MRLSPLTIALLLLPVFAAGCSYLGTAGTQAAYAVRQAGAPRQRVYKHMLGRETYFVFGQIEHKPASAGRLAVLALSDRWHTNEVVDVNWFSRDGSYYGLNLPEGEYRLLVASDADGDGHLVANEVLGGRRVSVGPAAAPDRVLGDCDIDLRRRVALGTTGFRVAVPAHVEPPVAESVFFPKGTLRTLDDPIFSPRMATLGLYRPAEFLERAPMMFYALEEDVGYKVPVVFVHGIDGSPRDFAPMLARLDRTRYKAWFFYYPTGQELSHVAAMFHRVFLSGKVIPLSEMPLVIVAHSMGGVVVREAMNRCTGRAEEAHVAQLITIASPLGGHPAAHLAGKAPLAVPSWRDLDPEGTFIANLHRRALPAGTEYHLFYTKGAPPSASGEAGDDGVVPIASQLVPAARREAAEQIGFADSHTGVLRDPVVADRVGALISRVKSPFPDDHMRELLRGGYELPAGSDCTPLEAYLIRTIGHYMDALVAGRLQPLDPSQTHFVDYCRGKGTVKYPAESAWTKLCRALPDRDKD